MSTNFNSGLSAAGFPTSSDIWLELDGKKVAVVQSYNCKTTRSSYSVAVSYTHLRAHET